MSIYIIVIGIIIIRANISFQDVINNHVQVFLNITSQLRESRIIRSKIEIAFKKLPQSWSHDQHYQRRTNKRANKRRSANGVVNPREKNKCMQVLFCLILLGALILYDVGSQPTTSRIDRLSSRMKRCPESIMLGKD